MTIKSRLRTIERRHGRPVDRQLVVLWPRGDEGRTRRRVERARRLGWRVRVVRFGITESAGDGTVLAASVPDLPDWLSGRSAEGAPS